MHNYEPFRCVDELGMTLEFMIMILRVDKAILRYFYIKFLVLLIGALWLAHNIESHLMPIIKMKMHGE